MGIILGHYVSYNFGNANYSFKFKVTCTDSVGNSTTIYSNVIKTCTTCAGSGTLSTMHNGEKTSSKGVKNHGEFRCFKCKEKDSGGHAHTTLTCRQCGETKVQCRCYTHQHLDNMWGTCPNGGGTCTTCSGTGIVSE